MPDFFEFIALEKEEKISTSCSTFFFIFSLGMENRLQNFNETNKNRPDFAISDVIAPTIRVCWRIQFAKIDKQMPHACMLVCQPAEIHVIHRPRRFSPFRNPPDNNKHAEDFLKILWASGVNGKWIEFMNHHCRLNCLPSFLPRRTLCSLSILGRKSNQIDFFFVVSGRWKI